MTKYRFGTRDLVVVIALLPFTLAGLVWSIWILYDANGEPRSFELLLLMCGFACLAVGHVGWLFLVIIPQLRRMRWLRAEFPDRLVQPATSSDHFLAELEGPYGLWSGAGLGLTPVLVVDASGISVWKGYRRPRQSWHVPVEDIESVTRGRTWYGVWLVHPTIDIRVRGSAGSSVVAFAPTHEDWRYGSTMASKAAVQAVVDSINRTLGR